MMHSEDKEQPSDPSAHDAVLGRIPAGPRDSQLGATERPAVRHRSLDHPAPDLTPPPDPEGTLKLPRGGLVAMRKSGGLRFSSREVVVYRDGRLVHRRHATGLTIYTGTARRLTQDEIAELSRLIEQSEFPRLAGTAGRQPPDAFVYEIVARIRRRLKATEVFQGGIPESLAPLIRLLDELMPRDVETFEH